MTFATGLGRDSERVLLALRDELEQGVYPVRSLLPGAEALRLRFGVSRNTVLRALARLNAEGYIESRRGVGTRVLRSGRRAAPSRTVAAMFTFDTDSLIAAQNEALERGFLMCVYSRHRDGWDPAPERRFLERVRAERHLGLLANLTPTAPTNVPLLGELEAAGVRILHIEPHSTQPPTQAYVLPDYLAAGQLAARTAVGSGFRRLVFAGTASDWPAARLFRQGVAETVVSDSIALQDDPRYYAFPTGTTESAAARAELARELDGFTPGTAYLCRSVDVATEIHRGLCARGWEQGADFLTLAVGYLNESLAGLPFPAIDFDRPTILRRAIGLLTAETWQRLQERVAPRLLTPTTGA